MMELKDTIEMMTSPDYKQRFRAEFVQTKIRYEKLKSFNNKYEARERYGVDRLGFKPSCPFELLREQQSCMGQLLHDLEVRAAIEDIDISDLN